LTKQTITDRINRTTVLDLVVTAVLTLALSGAVLEMSFMRMWLGRWIPKIFILIFILLYTPVVVRILSYRKIAILLFVMFFSGIYICINSVGLIPDTKSLALSSISLILITTALMKRHRLQLFSIFILIPLSIIVLSPGLSKILTMTRDIGSMSRTHEDCLTGLAGHYINYSMRSTMAFFAALALFLISKSRLQKALFGFVSATAFIAAMTAGSRGGVIALLCGCAFFVFIMNKKTCGQKLINYKHLLLFVTAAACFLPWRSIFQTFTMEYLATNSLGNRWRLYNQGIQMFMNHPLIGIGWGGFRAATSQAQHSNWLRTFVELGLMGGIYEIVLWLIFFKIAFSARRIYERLGDKDMAVLVICWTSIMVGLCVWQAYENMGLLAGNPMYFLCFGVVSAAYVSAQKQLSRDKVPAVINLDFNPGETRDFSKGKANLTK
jgi:O-antigen ligase